jgi:hypothetical protein
MSNKIIVPIIIVLSLITIGVASLTQLNKAPGKVAMNNSQSSESVWSIKSQVDSGSSQNVSKVTESLNVSSPQAEKPTSELSISPNSEVVEGSKVTYIDRNNPPQYIKDYLACETKDLKDEDGTLTHFSFFEKAGEIIKYQCPPNFKSLGCKVNVTLITEKNKSSEYKIIKNNDKYLSPYKQGWNCDLFNPINFIPFGFMDSCGGDTSKRNFEPEGYYLQRIDLNNCLIEYNPKAIFDKQNNLDLIKQIKASTVGDSKSINNFIILIP